jgi:hypothetical protein
VLRWLAPSDKAEAVVRLGFEHIGNLYMEPSWWFSLQKPVQNAAIARMPSGGAWVARGPDCLRPDGVFYVPSAYSTEILAN